MQAEDFLRGTPLKPPAAARPDAALQAHHRIRRRAVRRLADPGQRASVQGALEDGDRRRSAARTCACRAPAAPTPACMRSARSRISISTSRFRRTDCATRSTRICGRIRWRPVGGKRRRRFRRALLGGAAALSLSHRQPPRRSRARAAAAPGGCRAGSMPRRCTPPRSAWSASTTSRPSAPPNARPNRRRRRSTGSTCRATATRSTIVASARSFLHNQVRSMVGSLVLVGDGKWSADDLAARARRPRPRRLRPGRAAGRALSGAGGY